MLNPRWNRRYCSIRCRYRAEEHTKVARQRARQTVMREEFLQTWHPLFAHQASLVRQVILQNLDSPNPGIRTLATTLATNHRLR